MKHICLLLLVTLAFSALLDTQALNNIDVQSIGCDKSKLYDAEEGLQKLQEALSLVQTGRLEQDIKELREIQMLARRGIDDTNHVSFVQVSNLQYLYMIKHKFQSLSLIQMPGRIFRPQTDQLKQQINMVLASTDQQTRKTCCEMLFNMIELLLLDLLDMEAQCKKPITINIEGEIRKIQIIRGDCENEDPEKPKPPIPQPPKEPTPQPPVVIIDPPVPLPPSGFTPKPIEPILPPLPPPPPVDRPNPEPPKPEPPKPDPPKPVDPPKPEPPKPEPPKPEPPKPVDPTKPEPPKPEPPKPEPPKPEPPVEEPKKPEPPKPKTPTPAIVIQCVKGLEQVVDLSVEGAAAADTKVQGKEIGGAVEYGYGFWLRFLTRYPDELLEGRKKNTYYFISRLSSNPTLGDLEFGDRTLAIWLYDTGYTFATVDTVTKNNNINKLVPTGDIEGQWTYIYYSYSLRLKKAVGHVKVGTSKLESFAIPATHSAPTFLRMIIGGKHLIYPGFNGQITKPVFKLGDGAFVETEVELFDYSLKCNPIPVITCGKETKMTLVHQTAKFSEKDTKINEWKTSPDNLFPTEYSAAGWYKWIPVEKQEPWHLLFRLYGTKENQNAKNLGDRTLSSWLGTGNGGVFALATYSYNNQFGEGTPNIHNTVAHKNQHLEWHFVYMGYSFKEKKVHAIIQFKDSKEERTFENINHYLVQRLQINLAKDPFYPSWNGYIAHFRVQLCDGAYDPAFPRQDRPSPTPVKTPPPVPVPQPPKTPIVIPPKPVPIKPETPEVLPPTPKPKPEPPKPVEPEVVQKCIEGQADIGDASSAPDTKPIADIKVPKDDLKGVTEYGYGFWCRWLTRHPEVLFTGNTEPWYFISRLTVNEPYDNVKYGDRTLAIWLGKEGYHFTTTDKKTSNPNVNANIKYTDIEGVWTYIHYSYSPKEKKVVGFLYANKKTETITIPAEHDAPQNLRFILGGNDLKIYPGFNGQFTRPVLKIGPGSFIGTPDGLQNFALMCNPQPKAECGEVGETKLIQGVKQYNAKQTEQNQFNADNNNKFPDEYAVGGWFIWQDTAQEQFHLAYRTTINGVKHNKNAELLGDRTLSAWLDKAGNYHLATYTYDDMFGKGNPNVNQVVPHGGKHTQWHYLYFAYSRVKRQALSISFFFGKKEVREFNNVNHYLSPLYKIFVGKDSFYPAYNGFVGDFKFWACKSAFNPEFIPSTEPKLPKEPTIKVKTPLPPPPTKTPEEFPEPKCQAGADQIADSAVDNPKPLADFPVEGDKLKDVRQYGYGFWFRYLTRYPVPLFQGKKDAWYFISRLTNKPKYGNVELGDRVLAVWQGLESYAFITNDVKSGNPNIVKSIPYGTEIEGLWTYFYYSYSSIKNQAVAFLKYGESKDYKSVVTDAVHSKPTYLRLIIAGTDLSIYPALNGQIARPVLKVGYGSFIENAEQFEKYALNCNPIPVKECSKIVEQTLIADFGKFVVGTTQPNEVASDPKQAFPDEYSISGWFKWRTVKQEPWHLAFRLHINRGPDNADVAKLGDRTLAVWASNQGNYAFSTYTYTNLIGAGNPNVYKEVPYGPEINDWHFIQFSYSRAQKKAIGFVQFKARKETIVLPDVNHFFSPQVYVNIGKDRFYPSWSGYIGKFKLNLCGGAFVPEFPTVPPIVPPQVTPTPKAPEPPKEPTPSRKCVSGQSSIGVAAASGKTVVDLKIPGEKLNGVKEYGYGFWTRWLTKFPDVLTGITEPWYFVSRLTTNDPYDNIRFGDRTLAIWIGQGGYTFITNDKKTENPNVVKQLPITDIDGVWTYIHFSYSLKAEQAVGFIFAGGKYQTVVIPAVHPAPKFLRLVVGGSDLDLYPGFNGQFSSPIIKLGHGSYVSTEAELKEFVLACNPQPQPECDKQYESNLVQGIKKYDAEQKEIYEYVKDENHLFPEEYAVRGWFKWNPTKQQPWHLAFRVTINDQKTNKNAELLGDRDLSAWLGTVEGGSYALATYTYTNIQGAGNANQYQYIKHQDKHTEWHYIYFAYNRSKRQAYSAIWFKDRKEEKTFDKVNHFLAPYYRVFVGKDQFYPAYNGYVADFKFILCQDAFNPAFKPGDEPKLPKEPTIKVKTPLPPPKTQTPDAKPNPVCQEGDEKVVNSAVDQPKPLADIQVDGDKLKDVREYGYGFWVRFLTRYPVPLYNGKKEPWYFVSRLTNNVKYGNVEMGDRVLAIWLGQEGYTFITNDVKTTNPNVYKAIPYGDIEGVWTYIYFSYSSIENKVVGFLKYGDNKDYKSVTIDAFHIKPTYLRLIIGGTDLNLYPGFNGQVSRAIFKVGYGSYYDTPEKFENFACKCNPIPKADCAKKAEIVPIPTSKKYELSSAVVNEIASPKENPFPTEYSISGWFKFTQVKMEPWHLAFRLHINKELENKNSERLGDRTLAVWASPSNDGIYAFATYTYTNLNGAGNPNLYKAVPYGKDLTSWHFIFFAYSKDKKKAAGFVQFKERKEIIDLDANHFLNEVVYVNIGKDRFYPSWNGYIGKFTLNLCGGAFLPQFPTENVPPPVTPTPKIVEEQKDICLRETKLIEVTTKNVRDIIANLEKLEKEWKPERTCFCTLPQIRTSFIELHGEGLHGYEDHPVIQRLIAQNQVRLRY